MAISPCIADTDCIDLSIDGSGNLTAQPIVADDGCLECTEDGLYVAAGGEQFTTASTTPVGTGITLNPLVGGFTINLDQFYAAYGNASREVTTRASINYTNNNCRPVLCRAEWSSLPAFGIFDGWWVVLGLRNELVSPDSNFTVFPSTNFSNVGADYVALGPWTNIYPVLFSLDPGESCTVTVSGICQVFSNGAANPPPCTPFPCNEANLWYGVSARLQVVTAV